MTTKEKQEMLGAVIQYCGWTATIIDIKVTPASEKEKECIEYTLMWSDGHTAIIEDDGSSNLPKWEFDMLAKL